MKRIDIYFLLLATILLIVGAVLGIVMGSSEDFRLTPVHAHLISPGARRLRCLGLSTAPIRRSLRTAWRCFTSSSPPPAQFCCRWESGSQSCAISRH